LSHWYSGARVATVWPLTVELARPELGYVGSRLAVDPLADPTAETLQRLDWRKVQALAIFSRNSDSQFSPLRIEPVRRLWQALFGYAPPATEQEVRRIVPYPVAANWRKNGQWMDIFLNPGQRLSPPSKPLRAGR
jgi:hypothetical protein